MGTGNLRLGPHCTPVFLQVFRPCLLALPTNTGQPWVGKHSPHPHQPRLAGRRRRLGPTGRVPREMVVPELVGGDVSNLQRPSQGKESEPLG